MAASLSAHQQTMLAFVRDYLREHGYAPSIREITDRCGISTTSVTDYNLHVLARRGFIRREPDIARGITMPGCQCSGCPCCAKMDPLGVAT